MHEITSKMHWLGWIVLILTFTEAGWLAYDGGHALIVGDYVTPKSGQYAGQLGPWAKVVSAVGISWSASFYWEIDANGDGMIALPWRDSVTFSDGTTVECTGRFANDRPGGATVTTYDRINGPVLLLKF